MVKLKDIPNLMISVQKSLIGNNVRYGYQKAIIEQGKKEITINEDKAYAEFSSCQAKHDCPGFDCTICYQAFQALVKCLPTLLECKETK